MKKTRCLEDLIYSKQFRFDRLIIENIDNNEVAKIFSPEILREEYCLFSNTVHSGDEYIRLLHSRVVRSIENRTPLPVVRFADGEYAFYRYTLGCNGLYQQAESVEAIGHAMPRHVAALTYLARLGILAPLIFPGNSQIPERPFLTLKKDKRDATGAEFLDFLQQNHVSLTPANYIPFYVIYAYLSSPAFAQAVDNRNICILNSDNNKESCGRWFNQMNSFPKLSFVDIPKEYVATQWNTLKTPILEQIPVQTDLCIVGAGVGALLVCNDIAEKLSIPAIDAGHVLNMMNGRVDKSNGARLYTLRKPL